MTYRVVANVGTRSHLIGTGLDLAQALAAIERTRLEGIRLDSGPADRQMPTHVLYYPPYRIDQIEAIAEALPGP